jgi:hypothetical protein
MSLKHRTSGLETLARDDNLKLPIALFFLNDHMGLLKDRLGWVMHCIFIFSWTIRKYSAWAFLQGVILT